MLSFHKTDNPFCDGMSRRSFLEIGGLSLGAFGCLPLSQVLAKGNKNQSKKAIINIFLAGGPSHQDMWDPKPDAPENIRGEFKAISTNVPGIRISEVFPKIAKMADKFAFLRAVVGSVGDHDGYQCMSGWGRRDLADVGGYPCFGSVAQKLKGSREITVPSSIGLSFPSQHRPWAENGQPGFLGSKYAPYYPNLNEGKGQYGDIVRLPSISMDRLENRKALVESLDKSSRAMDSQLSIRNHLESEAAAFDLLSSSKLANALDITLESDKTREMYGSGKPYKYRYDGTPTPNEHLLVARRLIEAGTRVVSLSFGRWDSHSDNFNLVRDHGGKLDQCLSALIQDLTDRGMIDDVTVVVWGEFGRTPLVNKDAGRDHWPQVAAALIAGGGLKTGQVIGSTDSTASYPDERPVHFKEIAATLYSSIGIDTQQETIEDPSGRPIYLLGDAKPVPELI